MDGLLASRNIITWYHRKPIAVFHMSFVCLAPEIHQEEYVWSLCRGSMAISIGGPPNTLEDSKSVDQEIAIDCGGGSLDTRGKAMIGRSFLLRPGMSMTNRITKQGSFWSSMFGTTVGQLRYSWFTTDPLSVFNCTYLINVSEELLSSFIQRGKALVGQYCRWCKFSRFTLLMRSASRDALQQMTNAGSARDEDEPQTLTVMEMGQVYI